MDLFLFVFSYIIQLLASGILLYRIWSVRSIYGLSLDTQMCFLFATVSRCVWTINTRIVESNLFLAVVAVIELLASLGSSIFLVYVFLKLGHTTTLTSPKLLSAYSLVPIALLFSVIINPGESFKITSQVLVAFTMYVEAIALVPQLWLIRKMDDVEALTSHYLGLLVIARLVRMGFWIVMFMEGQRFLGLFLADVLHTVLSADYLYLWIRKLRHGGRLVYSL